MSDEHSNGQSDNTAAAAVLAAARAAARARTQPITHGSVNGANGFVGSVNGLSMAYEQLRSEVEALCPEDPAALDRVLDAIFKAALSATEREMLLKIARAKVGLTLAAFERVRRGYQTMPNNDASTSAVENEQQLFDDAFAKCRHLLHAPDLMIQFILTVQSYGVVGEGGGIIATKLTLVSRLLDDPANLLRTGPPSSGKNAVVSGVLHLANEGDDYVFLTAGSAKALVYLPGGLKHKLLYMPEAASLASRHGEEDPSAVMIRTWISEGKLVYYTVEEVHDRNTGRTAKVGREVKLEGPIAVILTTARDNVEDELMTRLLVSAANESQQQTVAVTKRAADKAAGKVQSLDQSVVDMWRAVETCLRIQSKSGNKVVVPFADKIHTKSSFNKIAQRREFSLLMSLTMASALLHQWQRERQPDGAIVATKLDYYYAQRCVAAEMGAAGQESSGEALKAAQAVETLLRQEHRTILRCEVARQAATFLAKLPNLPQAVRNKLRAMSVSLKPDELSFRRVLALTQAHRGSAYPAGQVLQQASKSVELMLTTRQLCLPTDVRVSRRLLGRVMGVTASTAQRRRDQAIEAGLIDDTTPENGPQARSVAKKLRPALDLAGKANRMRSDSPYPNGNDI
jgi:hypothetical protein